MARLGLAGSLINPPPVVLQFPLGLTRFNPLDYLTQGYTDYDVIVIGAGGGSGNGWIENEEFIGEEQYFGGGTGGGGGVHRVRGLLSLLSSSIDVYVGRVGTITTGYTPTYGLVRPGGDGEASYFGSICMASGGKGGGVPLVSMAAASRAPGGAGGVGGSRVAGGGGVGGRDGSINGVSGTWDGIVGQGGGAGCSGISWVQRPPGSTTQYPAGNGGRGAYNVADTSVSDTTIYPSTDRSGNSGRPGTTEGGSGSGGNASSITGVSLIGGAGSNNTRNLLWIPSSPGGYNGLVVVRLYRV